MAVRDCDFTLTHNGTPVDGVQTFTRAADLDDAEVTGPFGLLSSWLNGAISRAGGNRGDGGYALAISDHRTGEQLRTFPN